MLLTYLLAMFNYCLGLAIGGYLGYRVGRVRGRRGA